jgi:hypothetical protein
MTLRIGLLTTWNTRCGIAEYSRHLAQAMRRRNDVEITVLGSRNFGERAVREYEDWALPVFDVQAWNPSLAYSLDVDRILELELDVLHVQYSNMFFHRHSLVDLMRRFSGAVALTYHDKIVPKATFPHRLADLLYAHREDVGIGPRRLIPQGVEVRPPVVKTFGLGKSRADVVAEICERNGWRFETSFGEQRWIETEELRNWLRDSDAIVLWYDEDLTSGGSAAAPMALSSRRPVFVNDTEWFRDIEDGVSTLRKVGTSEELETAMSALFTDPYIEMRSWEVVSSTLVEDYRAVLAAIPKGDRQGRPIPLRGRLFAAGDPKPRIARKRRLLNQILGPREGG